MTIAQVLPRPAATPVAPAPPATPAVIRSTVESSDLGDLTSVGLALHLFTEIVRRQAGLDFIALHRATTLLTRQVRETLAQHPDDDALRAVLRLVTDGERLAHPDGRTASGLCGDAWPAVRAAAFARCEQSIQGAVDYGVQAMLRLAATRAVAEQAAWWGTPLWRSRLAEYTASHRSGSSGHPMLADFPEHASDSALLAIVA